MKKINGTSKGYAFELQLIGTAVTYLLVLHQLMTSENIEL